MNRSEDFRDRPRDSTTPHSDPTFERQVQRLHEMTVWARWLVVGLLWLSVGLVSLWALRSDIKLLLDHFTWAALRYSLSVRYNPIPALGLFACASMTIAVLVWQSRNILFGMPQDERSRLEQQVLRIRHQGPTHPFWKWICKD